MESEYKARREQKEVSGATKVRSVVGLRDPERISSRSSVRLRGSAGNGQEVELWVDHTRPGPPEGMFSCQLCCQPVACFGANVLRSLPFATITYREQIETTPIRELEN